MMWRAEIRVKNTVEKEPFTSKKEGKTQISHNPSGKKARGDVVAARHRRAIRSVQVENEKKKRKSGDWKSGMRTSHDRE